MSILSIQSRVAYGHVGNAGAVFALQRLGHEVWALDTTSLSNHPGHGVPAGEIMGADRLSAMVEGIDRLAVLRGCEAVLSGYLGLAENGPVVLEAVRRVRLQHPGAIYACDPVMGDAGPGFYVRPGIADFFAAQAVPAADILSPNFFEFQHLTGAAASSTAALKHAAAALRGRMRADGPRLLLVTSVRTAETPAASLDTLVASDAGLFRVRTPYLNVPASGAGDVLAALFLGQWLRGGGEVRALERAVSSVAAVLAATLAAGGGELALIASQAALVAPSHTLTAEQV